MSNREKKSHLKILILWGILSILFTLNLLIGEKALANPPQRKDQLKKAIKDYKSAKYNQAIQLLNKVINTENISVKHRIIALKYLGRCYVASRAKDNAKQALQQLLNLEPPVVDFDPDNESPPFMKIYYEARKDQAGGSYKIRQPDPGIKTMAILDFQNNSITDKTKYDPMERGFSDIMIHRLNQNSSLKVVERERLQWILDEMKIQNKYDMQGAVRAGKQLGVHTILLGSFILMKKEIWLSARLVKVESGEVLLSQDVQGKIDNFFKLTDQLSGKIQKAIDTDIIKLADSKQTDSLNSLEAMLAYSEGLVLLDKGNYQDAYQKFQLSLSHDPNYTRAHQKAESIKNLFIYSSIK